MQNDEDTQQDDLGMQSPVPNVSDENAQQASSGQGAPPLPSANDVLAQQMGTDYTSVENLDKQELQKDLSEQIDSEGLETTIPGEGAVDDRNTSDGQLIGS